MTSGGHLTEASEIDAFLAEPKRLEPEMPTWKQGSGKAQWHASWNLLEPGGICRGALKFRFNSGARFYPTVSVVFRGQSVWRVDVVPKEECKPNPLLGLSLGLPPMVCGPHEHAWPDNRAFVAANGFTKGLPCRRPQPRIIRLPQALMWVTSQINVTLEGEQRTFDVPPQSDLFEGQGR